VESGERKDMKIKGTLRDLEEGSVMGVKYDQITL
jgi:hypothetical protein